MMGRAEHHDDGPLFGTGNVDGHANAVDGDGGGRHSATLQAGHQAAGGFTRRAGAYITPIARGPPALW